MLKFLLEKTKLKSKKQAIPLSQEEKTRKHLDDDLPFKERHTFDGMCLSVGHLTEEETRLLIDVTIASRHSYHFQLWMDQFCHDFKNLTYKQLIDFRSDAIAELACKIENELPCFWAEWLDGFSRLSGKVSYDYDEIDESRFYGCDGTWDECEFEPDDDSPIIDMPSDDDSDKIPLLVEALSAASPQLNWNTQMKGEFGYPEKQDFRALLSPKIDLLDEITTKLREVILQPLIDEARELKAIQDDRLIDLQSISDAVFEHKSELLAEYRKSLRPSKYGAIDASKAPDVAKEFFQLIGLQESLLVTGEWDAVDEILRLLRSLYDQSPDPRASLDDIPEDPIEFEVWCLGVAKEVGLSGHITSGSGDQGVDVVLYGPNVSVGVQCKRVSRPCGNSAVQEVVSGIKHYNLERALVVSTAGFTRSAEELAVSCEVSLCLASDLKFFFDNLMAKAQ